MAKFNATFKNGLDSDRNTCEFPTDSLNANGAEIETFDFISSKINKNENFARETWQYEVPDEDAERFADGLGQTETVIAWKRVKR